MLCVLRATSKPMLWYLEQQENSGYGIYNKNNKIMLRYLEQQENSCYDS